MKIFYSHINNITVSHVRSIFNFFLLLLLERFLFACLFSGLKHGIKSGKNEELQLPQISQNTDQCHITEHMGKIPVKSAAKETETVATQITKI